MARYSSVNQMSGAQVVAGPAVSNPIATEAMKDARVFVDVSALGGGSVLDVFVQISHDGTTYYDVLAFNPINANGVFVALLEEHQISKYTRLRYAFSAGAGPATITATLEGKFGN